MPTLTICVLNYNGKDHLEKCLDSINKSWGIEGATKIIIDNASKDDSWKVASKYGFSVHHETNRFQFITGLNAAFNLCDSDFLLFTQADLEFELTCINFLLKAIKDRPLSLIQPVFYSPEGKIDNAGMNWVWPGYGLGITKKKNLALYETNICTDISFITSKAAIEKIGRYDINFAPAYYEDCDLALRCKKLGIKHYVDPRASVTHWHTSSFGKFYKKKQISDICFKNRQYLIRKHYRGFNQWLRLTIIRAAQFLHNLIVSSHNTSKKADA